MQLLCDLRSLAVPYVCLVLYIHVNFKVNNETAVSSCSRFGLGKHIENLDRCLVDNAAVAAAA